MNRAPGVSVIIPITEDCNDFEELNAKYLEALSALDERYEVIYVLDIYDNKTAKAVEQTVAAHDYAKSITLSRQFGDSTALQTGIQAAAGERLLILPGYHQVEPNDVLKVLQQLQHCDMAVGERDRRQESLLNRLRGQIFNRLIAGATATGFGDMGCDLRALSRQVADEVSFYGDQHRFLPVLAHRMGFDVHGVPVQQSQANRPNRSRGFGAYTRAMLDILNVVFLTRFTKRPLRFFGLVGITLAALGGLVITYVVAEKIFWGVGLSTRPALVLGALMLVVGLQIMAIGLIGEIVIFSRAKDLPEYYVKKIIKHRGTTEPGEGQNQENQGPAADVQEPENARWKQV